MSDKVLGSVMVVGGGIAGLRDLSGSLPIRFEVQLPEEAAPGPHRLRRGHGRRRGGGYNLGLPG